jgi:predicted nucleic acid-binding Zn ribbon protein
LPFYDFACKECQVEREDGTADVVLKTVHCSMDEITENPYPDCERCGERMSRVYNQLVFGLYQQNKGIFPMKVHNLGSQPVTVESRDDLKRKLKENDRFEMDFSEGARYRHKQAMARKRRIFSLNPS